MKNGPTAVLIVLHHWPVWILGVALMSARFNPERSSDELKWHTEFVILSGFNERMMAVIRPGGINVSEMRQEEFSLKDLCK
jgi:hypothetical protein